MSLPLWSERRRRRTSALHAQAAGRHTTAGRHRTEHVVLGFKELYLRRWNRGCRRSVRTWPKRWSRSRTAQCSREGKREVHLPRLREDPRATGAAACHIARPYRSKNGLATILFGKLGMYSVQRQSSPCFKAKGRPAVVRDCRSDRPRDVGAPCTVHMAESDVLAAERPSRRRQCCRSTQKDDRDKLIIREH